MRNLLQKGLFIYEDGQFRHVTLGNGDVPVITSFFEDSNHRIWIICDKGVWLYDEEKFTLINEEKGSGS